MFENQRKMSHFGYVDKWEFIKWFSNTVIWGYHCSMTFITLAFMTTVCPAHISPIVHDFDVSSCSISCQSVKIECVNARVWSGENARRHIHPVACVDQCSIVSYDRLLVIKRTISKRKYAYFWEASLNSHKESNIIIHWPLDKVCTR